MRTIVLLVAARVLLAQSAELAELVVRADLSCQVLVDGETRGLLTPGGAVHLNLSPGSHRIEGIATDGTARWQRTVNVASVSSQELNIPLRAAAGPPPPQNHEYWQDPASLKTWAASDNGSGVSWAQAAYYCRTLTLAGFHDWTLPSIDELQGLVGATANVAGYRITGPIKLTGWAWSSSPGLEPGEDWALDFGDGGRASVVAGDSGLNRALCQRAPSKPAE